MKVYEVVNYYAQDTEGLEARDVLGRYLKEENAQVKLYHLAGERDVEILEGVTSFEIASPQLLVSDYYIIEEHETSD